MSLLSVFLPEDIDIKIAEELGFVARIDALRVRYHEFLKQVEHDPEHYQGLWQGEYFIGVRYHKTVFNWLRSLFRRPRKHRVLLKFRVGPADAYIIKNNLEVQDYGKIPSYLKSEEIHLKGMTEADRKKWVEKINESGPK